MHVLDSIHLRKLFVCSSLAVAHAQSQKQFLILLTFSCPLHLPSLPISPFPFCHSLASSHRPPSLDAQVHPENSNWTCYEQEASFEFHSFFGFENQCERLGIEKYTNQIPKVSPATMYQRLFAIDLFVNSRGPHTTGYRVGKLREICTPKHKLDLIVFFFIESDCEGPRLKFQR